MEVRLTKHWGLLNLSSQPCAGPQECVRYRPDDPRAPAVLAISLAHLGQREEARAALDACERVRPGFAERWAFLRQYRISADNEHILEGLRKAGWKG